MDALPYVDFVMSGFIPTDVPTEDVQKQQMLVMLEQTTTPIIYVTTDLANTQTNEVVRKDGDFLETEHTLRHFREDYYPELTERENYDGWQEEGSLTLRDRARARVDQILKEHRTPTLPAETLEKLRSL